MQVRLQDMYLLQAVASCPHLQCLQRVAYSNGHRHELAADTLCVSAAKWSWPTQLYNRIVANMSSKLARSRDRAWIR